MLAAFLGFTQIARASAPVTLSRVETLYADWLDSTYAVATLSAGSATSVAGRDLSAWEAERIALANALKSLLPAINRSTLGAQDRRALGIIERTLAEAPTAPEASTGNESSERCDRAADAALDRAALSKALYACFEHYGNHIAFEDRSITRSTALELLQELDTTHRRRALFAALGPLWARVNADGTEASPYRRLMRFAAAQAERDGHSPVSDAARTLGVDAKVAEQWLVAVLEAWRAANPGPPIEPWDYWYHYASGVLPLEPHLPPERIIPVNQAYYRDLGIDLARRGVLYDLAPRAGKAPLAYADFVRIGREDARGWHPATARISANVEHGGLFIANEIIHETGHVVQITSIRTRPAFVGWGDDLFVEAFADVPSWSVAEPAWQQRYLGASVAERDGLRALFANVMLDVAWGLFELRLLREPDADPNGVWTEITSRYLNVRAHPELSWWALRVQLVDMPGYMINYGLGAILTADLRARIRARVGRFDAGNPRWYADTAEHLLRFGVSVDTSELLTTFLGRRVSVDPLLAQIARLDRPATEPAPAAP